MAKKPAPKVTTKKHLARLDKERMQRRYLLLGVAAVVLIVIAVIVYGILDQTYFQANRVVAQVGDQKITVKEFQTQTRFARYMLIREHDSYTSNSLFAQFYTDRIQEIETTLADPATVGKQALDGMIEDLVVAREATARGITVTDEELEKGMQEAFGFFAQGTPTTAPTSTPFVTATLNPTQEGWLPPTPTASSTPTTEPATATPTATPEQPTTTPTPEGATPSAPEVTSTPEGTPTPFPTATPYTLEGYQAELKTFVDTLSAIGYDEAHLRAYIRNNLLRQKLFEALTADVETQAEKVWARHILVATEEEANQVLERLNQGEDFARLASELSLDTSNKDAGGDLGWFTKGVMDPAFETATFALTIGQTSQPVQTTFGYHIIQLLGRQVLPLTDAELSNAKQNAWTEWLTTAKAAEDVVTHDLWMTLSPTTPEVTPYAGG